MNLIVWLVILIYSSSSVAMDKIPFKDISNCRDAGISIMESKLRFTTVRAYCLEGGVIMK